MCNQCYTFFVLIFALFVQAPSLGLEKNFCVDPASHICASKEATLLKDKALAAEELFEKYVAESEKNTPLVQSLLEKFQVKSCKEIKVIPHVKEQIECESARKNYLFRLIYTPKRIVEATKQINKAKQVMAEYLNHLKMLRTDSTGKWSNPSEAAWHAESMKQVVNFNPVFSFTRYYSAPFSFNFSPTELMGMILYADEVPNMLFFAALHEIGHLLYAPESLREKSDYPWKELVQCQRRPDTAEWHLQNMKCSQEGSSAVMENPLKKFDFYKPVADECLKGNVLSCLAISQALPSTVFCKKDQSIEGMADWFASSAFALLLQDEKKLNALFSNSETARSLVIENVALECSFINLSKYSDTTSRNNMHTHPMPLDRINTMLTNPTLKNIIGCYNENSPVIQNLNQPIDQSGLKYFCEIPQVSK